MKLQFMLIIGASLLSMPAFAGDPYFNVHCTGKNGLEMNVSADPSCENRFEITQSSASQTRKIASLTTSCAGPNREPFQVTELLTKNIVVVTTGDVKVDDGTAKAALVSTTEKFHGIAQRAGTTKFSFNAQVVFQGMLPSNSMKLSLSVYPVQCVATSFLNYGNPDDGIL